MKKLLLLTGASATLVTGTLIFTASATTAKPSWCSDPASAAAYSYPHGTYWAKQLAAYPDYYKKNNAYYVAHYGC